MFTTRLSPVPSPVSETPSPGPAIRKKTGRRPRILLVTPELSETRFLGRNGKHAPRVKAGGLADVSALLLDSLSDAGADVHVALPHYRSLFQPGAKGHSRRLHLCQDREFYYRRSVYDGSEQSNRHAALAFQRDVIQHFLPRVRPDIVHCHDWMTGLVPAAARSMGIKSLFTIHNLHDERSTLAEAEDRGIDAARFWQHLYYGNYPYTYESCRDHNEVSLLASGIHGADQVTTVSQSFLQELSVGSHGVSSRVVNALRGKMADNRAHGIVNSLPQGVSPEHDTRIAQRYSSATHVVGKAANKLALQRLLGLEEDADAPILFWPSRLDPTQKGCQLLAEILYRTVSDYWALGLQVVFVADGPYHPHFQHIAGFHGLENRIAVKSFDENLSRLAYAASDYVLMPSAYEPCGLSQMVGLCYGSLPIVHATGGLRDTVRPLEMENRTGNGFVFETHDSGGLRWAIDEAMRFHMRPAPERERQISRIMKESAVSFSPPAMIDQYLTLYRSLLDRL